MRITSLASMNKFAFQVYIMKQSNRRGIQGLDNVEMAVVLPKLSVNNQ